MFIHLENRSPPHPSPSKPGALPVNPSVTLDPLQPDESPPIKATIVDPLPPNETTVADQTADFSAQRFENTTPPTDSLEVVLKGLIETAKNLPIDKADERARIIYELSLNSELKKDENKELKKKLVLMCADMDPFNVPRYIENFHIESQDLLTELYSKCESATPTHLEGVLKLYKKNFNPTQEGNLPISDFSHFTLELHHTPLLPARSNKLDPAKIEAWVEAHPPEAKEIAQVLVNSLKHVGMNDFAENLSNTMRALESALGAETSKDYIFMADEKKSNQWITKLGLLLLSKDKRPTDVVSNYSGYLEQQCESETPHFPSTIVLLDDGIYSGSQMSGMISEILVFTINQKMLRPDLDIPFPDFYVAPVYATSAGVEFIQKSFPRTPQDIYQATAAELEELKDSLSPEELEEMSAPINICKTLSAVY